MHEDDYSNNICRSIDERFIAGLVISGIMLLIWLIDFIFNLQIF